MGCKIDYFARRIPILQDIEIRSFERAIGRMSFLNVFRLCVCIGLSEDF